MKCPIQCGQCCAYWRDVFSEEVWSELIECPHMGPKGCKLPRNKRPDPCIEYLCEIADEVMHERIELRQGVAYKKDCLSELPPDSSNSRSGTRHGVSETVDLTPSRAHGVASRRKIA